MKVLAIGGNGFIGSHVVDRLCTIGDTVVVFDRTLPMVDDRRVQVTHVQGSILDPDALVEAMRGVDCVIHMASSAVPSTSAQNPVADVQENLVGSLCILESMARSGVERLIFLSSGGTVYGLVPDRPVDESTPCTPISSYGVVKLAIEHFIGVKARAGEVSPLILRPSNPFGPRQRGGGSQGIIATALLKAASGEELTLWGDGSVVRDYLYVGDLVDLISIAVRSTRTGIYNVGSGQGWSVNDIVESVQLTTGRSLKINRTPAPARDVPRIVLDCGKARRDFGWSAKTSLHTGIQEAWEHLVGTREI